MGGSIRGGRRPFAISLATRARAYRVGRAGLLATSIEVALFLMKAGASSEAGTATHESNVRLNRAAQERGRKRLELVAQSVVQRQIVVGAPLVLQVKAGVGVPDRPLGLIADGAGDALALKHGRAKLGFGERGRLETLEE